MASGFAQPARQAVVPAAKTAAWANYGFDAGQSGFNNLEKTLSTSNVGSLTSIWGGPGSYDTGIGGIVESGGVIYMSVAFDGNIGSAALQALNAQTGNVLWTTSTSNGFGPAAVGDGLVFTVADNTKDVCAYKTKTGKEVWCDAGNPSKYGPIETGPTYADGTVYFTIEGAADVQDILEAVEAKTGAVRWVDNAGSDLGVDENPPAVSNGRVYNLCIQFAGSITDEDICAYDASSGSLIWTFTLATKTEGQAIHLIVGHNGVIYYSLHYDVGSTNTMSAGAINSSGSQLWSDGFTVNGDPAGAPFGLATDDRKLYAQVNSTTASDSPEGLYAFDVKNGKQEWQVSLPPSEGSFGSIPSVANGVIYTMYQTEGGSGGPLALNAANGTTLFETPSGFGDTQGARPIVVNATLYAPCGDSNGGICAFGLGEKKRN
jgi:outer membrane protein assembly factor BamB